MGSVHIVHALKEAEAPTTLHDGVKQNLFNHMGTSGYVGLNDGCVQVMDSNFDPVFNYCD